MNAFTTFPQVNRAIVRRPGRLIALSRVLDAMKDVELEATIELLIAMRDARDGDPDIELNGDETDNTNAEDEGRHEGVPHHMAGPGCPISDPDVSSDDDDDSAASDPSWIEWQTRGGHKLDRFGAEIMHRNPHGSICHDDEEDDDPREGNGDELDGSLAEDDFNRQVNWGEPGCPVSDPGGDSDERESNTWPERGEGRQPANMMAGVETGEDDAEPRFVPASMDRLLPANAS